MISIYTGEGLTLPHFCPCPKDLDFQCHMFGEGLSLPHFCSCPKEGPRFPMPYFVVMFNDLKYQVTNLFVDIGEIINHPCLNFLFKIGFAA